MPDEIIPRDRAELLWNAIINHTIEAVDAIRDRPELIAAAIAAGLPDMLGTPRDRYELFLRAIAASQGSGTYLVGLYDIDQSSTKWNTGTVESFHGGHELTVVFKASVPESTEYVCSFGQINTIHIVPNPSNLHIRVKADTEHDGKIVIELLVSNSSTITVDNCDPSVEHSVTINRNIYVDGVDKGLLPDRLYNGYGTGGVIYFGNLQGTRLGNIVRFTYK